MSQSKVTTILKESNEALMKENANLNGKTVSAKQLMVASETLRKYASEELLDSTIAEQHKRGFIHIHDFDYYALGTTTCSQIRLDHVLKGGFTTNGASLREAQTIGTAMAQAAIIIQASQNQQHGRRSA